MSCFWSHTWTYRNEVKKAERHHYDRDGRYRRCSKCGKLQLLQRVSVYEMHDPYASELRWIDEESRIADFIDKEFKAPI